MENKSDIKDGVLTENTAQGVFKYLREMESNKERMRARWIWELLQNARDASSDNLIATVEYESGDLTFLHNGRGFREKEIAHLIFHGSTKVEDDEAIGKFGSGFLTTHLLSPTIHISGRLEDDQWFDFCLERTPDSVDTLRGSMDTAWDDFNPSPSPLTDMPDGFTTRFVYPIEDGASDAVEEGIGTLKQCAPFVVVFNEAFLRIDIKSPDGIMNFEVTKRVSLPQDGLQEITVSENGNEKVYLLAEGKRTSVSVPLKPTDDGSRAILPINDAPRLFLGFPLIGTENFSFPTVINSFAFTPTEDRDGVYLWRGNDEANCENQAAMKEACELLISLIQFAASSGWNKTYALAGIPDIHEQKWLSLDEFQGLLKEETIEQIRQIPTVLCEHGTDPITPQDSILPFAEEEAGVEPLWDLFVDLEEFRHKLPRRNEAAGWYKTIKSWAALYEHQPTSFDEVFDGRKLALHIENKLASPAEEEYNRLEDLQELLQEGIDAIEWLDRLYQFLKNHKLFDDEIRNFSIFPDQAGYLGKLSKLYCDQEIDEKLKKIAELLDWPIREELRDKRLSSLANEVGEGKYNDTSVARVLIDKIRQYDTDNPDDNFAKASVRLFTWIVSKPKPDWDHLRRGCHQLRRMTEAARWMAPRKLTARLS